MSSTPPHRTPEKQPAASANFRRVLLVDDEPAVRAAFARTVSTRGFLVDTADSVAEALRLAETNRYPVVVTDLAMPGADGLELIRALRHVQPRARVVVLTGLPDVELPEDPEVCDSVVSVVRKPWDLEALVDTLHRSARLWEARSGGHPAPGTNSQTAQRILLIEDNDTDAQLIEAYFSIHGPSYCVERMRSLAPAMRLLETNRYDAILSDLELPDARGLDAVLRLQTISSDTPLVVMSGLDDETVALEAVQAGAQDFLFKGAIDGPGLTRSIRYSQERKQTELNLTKLANFDTLTGLSNRTHFSERLAHSLGRARRTGEHLAVFYLDLDGFKAVNDTMGHAAGDALLVEASRRLQGTARETDVLARLGGDEFAVVVDGLADASAAIRAAERILAAIARPYAIGMGEARVTASLGIAFYPDGGESVADLLKTADRAMYRAKARGKNTYEVFQAATDGSGEQRLDVGAELKRALAENEFVLHYQPQYDLRRGRIYAAEGLIRWQRGGGGRLLPPDEFLPLLEASSDILPTGAWTIRTACEDLRRWRRHMPLSRVSVNLSARQLDDDDLVHTVQAALTSTGIEPGCLELELTESAVMRRPEHAKRVLYQLKQLGVRLAMDDFGTGHSSLSHLYQLPFDTVKIDRSFTRDLSGNEKCRAVVRAIIALAKQLRLEIVAEGVETEAQRKFLTREGCDVLQGYLFGAPVPAGELLRWVAESAVRLSSPPRQSMSRAVRHPGRLDRVIATDRIARRVGQEER